MARSMGADSELVMGAGRGPLKSSWRVKLAQKAARLRADLSFAVIDALLITMAYYTALGLRFFEAQNGIPARWFDGFMSMIPAILVIHLIFNVVFGTYGHVWEHASVAEAVRMVLAAGAGGVSVLTIVLVGRELGTSWGLIPVGVVALGSMLTLAGMGAVRFRSRMFSFKRLQRPPAAENALVIGTGHAAVEIARRASSTEEALNVTGFVSANGVEARLLAGLPILGTLGQIADLIREHDIDQVIVAGNGDSDGVRELVDRCLTIDVRLRILPNLDDAFNGDHASPAVRDIELADLLPRPEILTDLADAASALSGKRVLITGAGGSIGSELVRQVLKFGPAEIIAVDHDETHLFDAGLTWADATNQVFTLLCDIRDELSVMRAFEDHRPEVVLHAAAHKQVPILENSPEEAVKTNVVGTRMLLEAGRRVGMERFVLISTDKAVRPISVMGASKRVAEMLVRVAAADNPDCHYSAVRFGNVLGSRGSVIPTFLAQIQRGGPVTVTDPDMVRYFMTVGEAVELVLQAAALSDQGEVFVLDMGEPIRILDLAHRLIRLHGLVPGRHIQVEMIGARPGEKLQEVLSDGEMRPASHPKISIAEPPTPDPATVLESYERVRRLANQGASDELRTALLELALGTVDRPNVISLNLFEESPQWS